MDDAGAWDIDDVRYVVQQGIEQRAVGVTGGRVHHQAGWLVDDQDIVVFVDDIQLDGLGNPLALGFLLGVEFKDGTAMHDVTWAQYASVHGQAALFDPGGKARARVLGEQLCGDLIEALAAQFGRHLCAKLYDLGHARTRRRRSLWFQLRACG
ncbi:hypothetical protein D3C80_1381190 [compost metagenome]